MNKENKEYLGLVFALNNIQEAVIGSMQSLKEMEANLPEYKTMLVYDFNSIVNIKPIDTAKLQD